MMCEQSNVVMVSIQKMNSEMMEIISMEMVVIPHVMLKLVMSVLVHFHRHPVSALISVEMELSKYPLLLRITEMMGI